MALTKSELDSLLDELESKVDTDVHRRDFGMGAYRLLFGNHPDYVYKFYWLKGCTPDNVFESDGIQYYSRTLVDRFDAILSASTDPGALDEVMIQTSKDIFDKNFSLTEFKRCEEMFVEYFNKILVKPENKVAMQRFFKFLFAKIATRLYQLSSSVE